MKPYSLKPAKPFQRILSFAVILSFTFSNLTFALPGTNLRTMSPGETSTVVEIQKELGGSDQDLGSQISNLASFNNLFRILDLLKKKPPLSRTAEATPYRDIVEFLIAELKVRNLIEEEVDDKNNVVILRIKDQAKEDPLARAIRRWVINPAEGIKAINFKGKDEKWRILGFDTELKVERNLEHETIEVAYRKSGYSPIAAHNATVNRLSYGQHIDLAEGLSSAAGRQADIGAGSGRSEIVALANLAQSLPEEGYAAAQDTYLTDPYQSFIAAITSNPGVFASITLDDINALRQTMINLSKELSPNAKVKKAIDVSALLLYEIARHPNTPADMAEAAYLTLEEITRNVSERESRLTRTNVVTLSACANYISKLTNNIETCQYVTSSTPFILREAVIKLLICDFDEACPAISYNLTALGNIGQNNQIFASNAISSLEDIIEHTIKDKAVIYKPHLIRIVTDYVIVFYHSGQKTKIYDYITRRTRDNLRMVKNYLLKDKNFPEGKVLAWKCDLVIGWCKAALEQPNPNKTLLAKATAPTEGIPFEDSLHRPGAVGTERAPIVKAEALELNKKSPYYSKKSMKDGLGYVKRLGAVNIRTPEEAKIFGKWLIDDGKAKEFPINVLGRDLTLIVEDGVGIAIKELAQVIEQAIERSGGDVNNLPQTLVIAFLDKSSHLFEDHLANGFIGINRLILNKIKSNRVQDMLIKVGLFHEFSHEVTGQRGELFEKVQLIRDAQYVCEENRTIVEADKKVTSATLYYFLNESNILQDTQFFDTMCAIEMDTLKPVEAIRSILEQAEIDRTNKLIEELKIITTRTLVEPKKIVIQRIEDNSRILREIVQSPNVSEQTFKVLIPALLDTITNASNKKPSDERRSVVHQCALTLLEITKNPLGCQVFNRKQIDKLEDAFYRSAWQKRPKLLSVSGVPFNRNRVLRIIETVEATLGFYSAILRNVAISDKVDRDVALQANAALMKLSRYYLSPTETERELQPQEPIDYTGVALSYCRVALEYIDEHRAEQQKKRKVEEALANIQKLSSGIYFTGQNILYDSLNILRQADREKEPYGLIFSSSAVFESGLGAMLPDLANNLGKRGRIVVVVDKGNEAQKKVIEAMNKNIKEFGQDIIPVNSIEEGVSRLRDIVQANTITYVAASEERKTVIPGVNTIVVVDTIIEALQVNNPEGIVEILKQFKQACKTLEKV